MTKVSQRKKKKKKQSPELAIELSTKCLHKKPMAYYSLTPILIFVLGNSTATAAAIWLPCLHSNVRFTLSLFLPLNPTHSLHALTAAAF